jgi:hypothetical protein
LNKEKLTVFLLIVKDLGFRDDHFVQNIPKVKSKWFLLSGGRINFGGGSFDLKSKVLFPVLRVKRGFRATSPPLALFRNATIKPYKHYCINISVTTARVLSFL